MKLKGVVVGLGVLGALAAACSSNDGGDGGSSVVSGAGTNSGGATAGSGGSLALGVSGGGASGASAGTSGGGGLSAGTTGDGPSGGMSGGAVAGGSSGAAGSGGRPPSAAHPIASSIYFCLGDGCPHGACSGGDVPSCDQVWGPLTAETPLCDPQNQATYCLVTNGGTWVIDCAAAEPYVEKCPGNCATAGGDAYCNG